MEGLIKLCYYLEMVFEIGLIQEVAEGRLHCPVGGQECSTLRRGGSYWAVVGI